MTTHLRLGISEFTGRLVRKIAVLLLYEAIAYLAYPSFLSSGILAFWDLAPIYKMEQLYRPFDFPWDHLSNTGLPNLFPGNIPYNTILIPISAAVGSVVLGQKIMFLTMLTFGSYGFYRLSRLLNASTVGSFCAGLLYLLNPWIISRIYMGHNTLVLAYALLPYAMSWFFQASREFGAKPLLHSSIVSALMLIASYHMFFEFIIMCLLFLPFAIWVSERRFESAKRLLIVLAGQLLLTFSLSFPILYQVYMVKIPAFVQRIDEAFYRPFPTWQDFSVVLLPATILGFEYFSNLQAFTRRRGVKSQLTAYTVYFGSLAIVGMLGFGGTPLLSPIYSWLYVNLPGFGIFRDATKFFMFTAIAVCFTTAPLVDRLLRASNSWIKAGKWLPNIGRAVTVSALLLLLLIPSWYYVGHVKNYGQTGPSTVDLPWYYQELDSWLRSLPGDFRIAFFPPAVWATQYEWAGHFFLDPLVALQPVSTIQINSEQDLTLGGGFTRWAYTSIYNNRTEHWGKLLGLLGVRYVIYRPDADMPLEREDYKLFNISYTRKIIQNQADLVEIKRIGPLVVYENPYWIPHIFEADALSIAFGDRSIINSLSCLQTFNFRDRPIVFADTENPLINFLPYASDVILQGDAYWNLMVSQLVEEEIIKPWEYVPPSSNYAHRWVKGDYTWHLYNGSMNAAPDSYVMTTSESETLTLPFTIENEGDYKLLIQVYTGQETASTTLKMRVDSGPENSLRSSRKELGSFAWTPAQDLFLSAGKHTIQLQSNGFAAVSKIAFIPHDKLNKFEQEISHALQSNGVGISYLIDDSAWIAFNPYQIANAPQYSSGAALSLSNRGTARAEFFAPRDGVIQVQMKALSKAGAELTIRIDEQALRVRMPPDDRLTVSTVGEVVLSAGRHRIDLRVERGKILIDYLVLRDSVRQSPNSSQEPKPLDYVAESSSTYRINWNSHLLIFLETFTEHWIVKTEGEEIQPRTVYSYANVYLNPKNVSNRSTVLTYSGLNYFHTGLLITIISFPLLAIAMTITVRRVAGRQGGREKQGTIPQQ